jgi:hypothetical protein
LTFKKKIVLFLFGIKVQNLWFFALSILMFWILELEQEMGIGTSLNWKT